jgi:hypothetical protein
MRSNILFLIAVLSISTLSLAGCGGDGGGGGGGASSPGLVSKGVITSASATDIVVNGFIFDVSGASVKLDGVPGTGSDLQPGMVVTVKGVFNNNTSHTLRRPATSVVFTDNMEGPVDSVNNSIGNNALIVMGQPVIITPSKTVFANFTSLGQLHPTFGNITSQNPLTGLSVVEVSGLSKGIDGFQATRITLKAQVVDPLALIPMELKGTVTVSSLDLVAKTFTIGGMTVDYSQVDPISLAVNPFNGGQFVEVQGVGPILGASPVYVTGAAPSFVVTSVKPFTEGVTANQGDHVIVEGYVSGLSGNLFTVEGTSVNAGTLSLLNIANSTNVRVEGTFSNGALNASKITLL